MGFWPENCGKLILGWSDFFGFTVGRISLRKGAVNGLIGWVPISSYIFQEWEKLSIDYPLVN